MVGCLMTGAGLAVTAGMLVLVTAEVAASDYGDDSDAGDRNDGCLVGGGSSGHVRGKRRGVSIGE